MGVTPWIDPGEDSDNYVIASNGTRILDNPNPFFYTDGGPEWMDTVIRGGMSRQGSYTAFEVGVSVMSADGCLILHADAGDQDVQTWNTSTTDPEDTSAGFCRIVPAGIAVENPEITSTSRSLVYNEPESMTFGSGVSVVEGPSYGLCFLAARDFLGPTGAVDIDIDPVSYGYPADSEVEWEYDYPELLGIELADGDPVSIADGAPYPNKWALNFSMFDRWVDGFSTAWEMGPFPDTLPGTITTDRPEMLWNYDSGIEGETGVDAADIWQPLPDSAGWEDHGWTPDYASGAGLPTTVDAMAAAWPDVTGLTWDVSEARFARIAVKFVLRARRFRFITPGDTPPRRFVGRPDHLAGGAERWAPHPKSIQGGRRWGGAVI